MWLVGLTWIIGIICIFIMKRIKPDATIAYAIYVFSILTILTIFVALYLYL
jgi:hypothetical protein